jgi:signal transduction histidine kinase
VSDRSARRLAVGIWIAAVLFTVAAIPLLLAARGVAPIGVVDSIGAVTGLLWVSVGARIATVRHGNAVGWLFCNVGLGIALTQFATVYTVYGLRVNPGMPVTGLSALIGEYGLIPSVGPLALLFLLFPDGRPPSTRWRWVQWGILGGLAVALAGFMVKPETLNNYREFGIDIPNPSGIAAMANVSPIVILVGTLITLVSSAFAVLALRYRSKRSTGEQREQIRWLAYVGALALVLFVLFLLSIVIFESNEASRTGFPYADIMLALLALTVALGVPVATTIAILKYRLYDIDVVINKTVVYLALAAFITGVYIGVVVGIGSALGRGGEPNLALSILATAVVAVAFQPVRGRVQRFANRLVFGDRASPYEVLSRFAERMASTYGTDDLLPRMAAILAEGTGATNAEVWLQVGTELRKVGAWPSSPGGSTAALPLRGDGIPELPGAQRTAPVQHQGELLGALAITKAPGEPITPTEETLVRDLAAQAGLVLRNVKLIEELRASRQRIVSAQDEERRRLERNIHDGAQQQLVALNVKLGLARTLAAKDSDKTKELILQLQQETQDALENLRDLARGIYPPLLADQGLVAALESQARKAPIPVSVHGNGVGRFPQETEAAVYFCILEALQNTAKYANASRATVRLNSEDTQLTFEVEDDGVGFDSQTTLRGSGLTNMADRVEALGGTLSVSSQIGKGTVVRGRAPVVQPPRQEHASAGRALEAIR